MVPDNLIDQKIKRLEDPHFKGAVAINLVDAIRMNRKTFPNHMIEVCEEIFTVHRVTIYFQKNSHLVAQVDEVIAALQSNGLIEYWERKMFDSKYTTRPMPTKQARNLDFNQLMGGFWIFLLGLIVACIVFLVEYSSSKFKIMKSICICLNGNN